MDRDQFWDLVEQSRRGFRSEQPDGNMDRQFDTLRELLLALPPSEIQSFGDIRDACAIDAYTWNLWGAAALLNEGACSDDGFADFRNWLISMGRKTYEDALADPDSIATSVIDASVEDFSFEAFSGVAAAAYHELTGNDMPWHGAEYPHDPRGQRTWETLDDLHRQYPGIRAAMQAFSQSRR